jgi:hypothetical protein
MFGWHVFLQLVYGKMNAKRAIHEWFAGGTLGWLGGVGWQARRAGDCVPHHPAHG